jgi:hypothetical protein
LRRQVFRLEQAPEPSDIIWGNCGVSELYRFSRKIVVLLVTGLLIIANYVAIYYITLR